MPLILEQKLILKTIFIITALQLSIPEIFQTFALLFDNAKFLTKR